jgi:hypothetical protein
MDERDCQQDGPGGADLRCPCGSLMARQTPEGIELKCRRCRRSLLVRLDAAGGVSLEPR